MAHKKKPNEDTRSKTPYTIGDAVKIADDIFKLSKEKKYNLGAFVHGLIFHRNMFNIRIKSLISRWR